MFGSSGSMIDPQNYCFGKTMNGTNITAELLMCFYEKSDVRYALYPIGEYQLIIITMITCCKRFVNNSISLSFCLSSIFFALYYKINKLFIALKIVLIKYT